jgi:flagellin FlaB
MHSSKDDDNAFTGLEAAIVLIAFVVVAAVFSYVVFGAGGYFAPQKKEVQEIRSVLVPSGPVSVQASGDGKGVGNITFCLQLAAGGTGIDMRNVTYTVSTPTKVVTVPRTGAVLTWVTQNKPIDADQTSSGGLLNPNEKVLVSIQPGLAAADLGVNTIFTVDVKPPVGAALPILRTTPAEMTAKAWYDI